jgi:hypothetical protein
MNNTKGFPTRYEGELTGEGWWSNYRKALPVAEAGGIIVAYGQHGTGKTRMAYEIAMNGKFRGSVVKVHGIPKDIPCLYTTAVDFFMEIRDTYRQGSERSEKQVIAEFTDAPFLAIDEIQERGRLPLRIGSSPPSSTQGTGTASRPCSFLTTAGGTLQRRYLLLC